MRERRRRDGSFWVAKGAVAMAVLAALSLAITVLFAERALDNAADVVVRGDGDTLVADVVVDLWEVEWPLTSDRIQSVLAKHAAQGLRYLAVIDRGDHHMIADAGAAVISRPFGLPGDLVCMGRRARLVALVPPPWETRAAPRFAGPWSGVISPRPLVVAEYEPPMLGRLQADLRGISICRDRCGARSRCLCARVVACDAATRRGPTASRTREPTRRAREGHLGHRP